MADVHSKEVRSFNMSRIRGKNTSPELIIRKFLFSKGLRYRLHDKRLPGTPDLVFPKLKTVIFVNGCFWHGHLGCRYYVVPKTRTEFWVNKISVNKNNDAKAEKSLTEANWKTIIIWECALKKNVIDDTLKNLLKELKED
ncbi:very short patch repair endonuclease [Mucilaginibacter sp.]